MQIPAFDAATLSLRRHDNDNADSSSQLGLACPEGQSAWAEHVNEDVLVDEETATARDC